MGPIKFGSRKCFDQEILKAPKKPQCYFKKIFMSKKFWSKYCPKQFMIQNIWVPKNLWSKESLG